MKTYINTKSQKANYLILLVCTSFVILTGCKKDEISQAPDKNGSNSELRKAYLPPPPYTMLMIEHNCMSSMLPDYDVYLRSDGKVTYRGWSHVAYLGTDTFRVDIATVSYIKNLFESANFFNIQLISTQYNDPYVATTYNSTFAIKRLIDYDQGIPQILIQIRKRAEEKLNIARYLEFKKYTASPVSNL